MIYFFGIVVIILVVFFYRKTIPELEIGKKVFLISLRSIAIITVLLLLLNPIYYFSKKHTVVPQILFLNDVSASMELKAKNLSKSQSLTVFKEKLGKKFSALNYKIIKRDFAAGLNGNHNSTLLSPTLAKLAKKQELKNVKAIFLFSDGWFKDENLDEFSSLNIPVYTFFPNYKSSEADLEIKNIKYNKTAYKDEITPFLVNIESSNYKGKAKLIFRENGKDIQSKQLDFSQNASQQIVLEHTFQKTGLIPFSVSIVADTLTEINSENNHYPGAIQVLDSRSKILIVTDIPNWDAKFILDVIRQNPHWKSEFLLKKGRHFFKGRKISDFGDNLNNTLILVLINEKNLSFSAEDSRLIETFVRNGGGLLVMGKPINALSEILPATKSHISASFRETITFTPESKQYQTFNFEDNTEAKNIPPVDYFYVNAKTEAKILAKINNEEQSAAILLKNYENGKILYFAFLNFWKWQLWANGNHYNRLVSDICNWLGRRTTEHFIAFPNKNIYFPGEKIKIRLNAYDEKLFPIKNLDAKITLFKNNENVFQNFMLAENDEYITEIENLEPGKYKFVISDDRTKNTTSGTFIVSSENPESRDHGFNLPLLSFIAARTGAKVISEKNLDMFSFPKAQFKTTITKTEIPIYRKWYVIALFIISFSLELFFRKRWGLL